MASSYIDQALIVTAKATSAVTAIFEQRLYHSRAPDKAAKPHAILRNVSPSNISELFGSGRMGQHLFQWMCVSEDSEQTPSKAFLGAYAFMDLFANYQGAMDGITVMVIWATGPKDVSLPQSNDAAQVVELEVHYIEP